MTSPASGGTSRGLVQILVATAVAGVSGYAVQLLAPALLPDESRYVAFSVFWSTLYLFVGAISGVQQEIARATTPGQPSAGRPLTAFSIVIGGVIVAATATGGILLAPAAFPAYPAAAAVWLGVGLLGYLLCAVLAGVLYGLSMWRWVATLTIVDTLTRGILVVACLLLDAPPAVLAAAVAVPFGAAFLTVFLMVRRRVPHAFHLDIGVRRLFVNSAATVVAAIATGAVVTGLPLLLRLIVTQVPETVLAGLIVVITITRAPLIVPLMALQSFLIVDLRDARAPRRRILAGLLALVVVTGAASVAAWVWGPGVLQWVTGGRYSPAAIVVSLVVASAGLVGALCITGAGLVATSRHASYAAGWVIAAVVTVAVLLVPGDAVTRTVTALLAAPLAGLLVHGLVLLRPIRRVEASEARSV